MIGWHHRLNGVWVTLEVGDGQGDLACCSPWSCKESTVGSTEKTGVATMKTVWNVFKKLNLNQNYDMTQLFYFWYLFEEHKNTNLKRYMHPYVHCSTLQNSQDIRTT